MWMDHRQDRRGWEEHALSHGRARRALERGRDQGDGRLPRRGYADGKPNERARRALPVAVDLAAQLLKGLAARRRSPPRRRKACSTRSFRRSRRRRGARLAGSRQGGRGHRRRALRRAAHRLGRQVRVRQLGERGCAVLRGAASTGRSSSTSSRRTRARAPRWRPATSRPPGSRPSSCRPAVVGLINALGQMFNAWKEQTPLVFYATAPKTGARRTRRLRGAARPGTARRADDEATWLARRADMIPETVRRAFKVAWTPPYGPTYADWNSDFNDERCAPRSSGTSRSTRGCACGRTPRRSSARPSCSSSAPCRCSSSATRCTRRRRSTRSVQLAELLAHAGDAGAPDARELPAAASALGRQHSRRRASRR